MSKWSIRFTIGFAPEATGSAVAGMLAGFRHGSIFDKMPNSSPPPVLLAPVRFFFEETQPIQRIVASTALQREGSDD